MARAGSESIRRVAELLRAPQGLSESIAALSAVDAVTVAPIEAAQIVELNAPAELMEKTIGYRYPAVSVYCEKITNSQAEKFRMFSGSAKVTIEVRVTHNGINEISTDLNRYVDAITRILDMNRGDWGRGMFYAGGYEISYSGVKQGGRNYVQAAKISVTIDVNL